MHKMSIWTLMDKYAPTVEKRAKTRVLLPFLNTADLHISEMSSVASKTPNAPPLKVQLLSAKWMDKDQYGTPWHEQHVQELVHDQIVEYLRYKENPRVTLVLVDQLWQLLFVRRVVDHNRLLIVHFSVDNKDISSSSSSPRTETDSHMWFFEIR